MDDFIDAVERRDLPKVMLEGKDKSKATHCRVFPSAFSFSY